MRGIVGLWLSQLYKLTVLWPAWLLTPQGLKTVFSSRTLWRVALTLAFVLAIAAFMQVYPPSAAFIGAGDAVAYLDIIAIAWVVVNQFRYHLGLHAGDRFGLVFKGYLGAELFFVAGGFIACHAWMRMRSQGGRYGSLLWRRLARVYPLHLATMAAMAALALASREAHEPYAASMIDLAAVPANLGLVQAWGVLHTVSWNFPSWLISAEWFALIVFPLTVTVAFEGWRGPWTAVLAPIPLFAAAYYFAQSRGVLFSDMTAQIGALQTVPAFLFGAGLYRFAVERGLSRLAAGRRARRWGWRGTTSRR